MKRELIEYKDLPYTVVGHSSLLPEFSITLTGEAIKEMARLMKTEQRLRITVGGVGNKFEIL